MKGYLAERHCRIKIVEPGEKYGVTHHFRRGDKITGVFADEVDKSPILRARCVPKNFPDPQPAKAAPAAAPAPQPAQEK